MEKLNYRRAVNKPYDPDEEDDFDIDTWRT